VPAINVTPRKLKINPIEFAVPNLPAFFRIRARPLSAEAQKLFPVIAIYIKYNDDNVKYVGYMILT